jgi:hypothetical protein
MQLHNRLSNLFQKETDRLLKGFLSDNPDMRKRYVEGCIVAVGTVLKPITSFVRHLLVVQGLDPEATPGDKQRLLIQEALSDFFNKTHDKDFDDDYDVSWAHQKFEKAKGAMKELNISEDKFLELTDLGRLPNLGRVNDLTEDTVENIIQRVNPIATETVKKELPLDASEGRNPAVAFNPGDALQQLKDFMNEVGYKLEEKKSAKVKTSKKKLNKGKRIGGGPKVQRVSNTEPIKEEPSTLEVKSNRTPYPPSSRTAARELIDIARQKKLAIKVEKEATPEFHAEMKVRATKAAKLIDLMVERGFCESSNQARQEQLESMLTWDDNNFDTLERVITKYGPTKDAISENKFKGSFRRDKV